MWILSPIMANGLDGRIVRIALKNFLTYDKCEFFPGDKLNVILGPNGTGKSSVVCAICLGLGGSPTLLGRAKDIGDYVKHRTNEAMVEIELLKSNSPNLVVKRIITKGNDGKATTKWFLNGKSSHQSEVVATVKEMNVQMNNLCQFLPQDKVVEFAKMNPQQLLEATEKAVGPPGMYDHHMKLIELRGKYSAVISSKEEKEQAKDRIEQRNKLLERDVLRHKEREKHCEKIDFLEKKKPWVEYKNARAQYVEANNDKTELAKRIAEVKKINAPLEKELKKCKETVANADAKVAELKDQGNAKIRKWKSMYERLEKEQEKVEEVKQELSVVKKEEAQRLKKIEKVEKDILHLQKEYEAAPDPESLRPEVDEMTKSSREIQININKYTKECQEFGMEVNTYKTQGQSIKSKIRQLENYENQRLETLRRIDKETYDAVLWLRENQHQFSGTVYEPIMTQINMKNLKDSVYLESIVSFNDMKAFVCQSREDQHKFSNQTRDVLKLNVNVVCPPGDAKDEYLPMKPLDSIKKYGFKSYVTDLYDAPKTVHQYLCESYNLHNIPVGGAAIEKNSGKIIEEAGVSRFCSTESIYTVRKSRYTGQNSTSVNALKQTPNLLKASVDMEQKKRLDAELEEIQKNHDLNTTKYHETKKLLDTSSKELEVLKEKRKNMLAQMKRRSVIATQIETRQQRLHEFQQEVPDVEAEERKAKKKITKINQKRLDLIKEYKKLVKDCIDIGKERLAVSMKQAQCRLELVKMEEKHRNGTESLRTLEDSHTLVSRRCMDLKTKARNLSKIAQDKTGKGTDGELIPKSLEEIFKTLPDTLEDIEALIHEEKARLNCQYETNPQVVHDFNRNVEEINGLSKEVEQQALELEEMQKEIDELLKKWLIPLESLLKRINEQYCDFFRRMGCAGQVSLQKDLDDDYKKYGVEIQVKFRAEEKLKVLTSYFQSGGERSVSTMLYLISLQELTKCPFRLVDEINQGMDPNNERRVFELVVETVCRPNTSQYFLITPKLLPDLHYTKGMTILTVLNGHWMVPHEEFHVKDFINRKNKKERVEEM